MCGRNSLFTPLPELEDRFVRDGQRVLRPRYNIAPGDDLRTYPISRAVNSPENDSREIIDPVDVDEQAGLDTFGA